MTYDLIEQNTRAPTRKLAATAIVGSVITVVAWYASEYHSINLPGEIQAALHTLAATIIAYFVRDRLQ